MTNHLNDISPLFKTEPFNHQLNTWEETWAKESYGILWEMGTGKSKLLIDSACALYKEGKINGILILAPKGV